MRTRHWRAVRQLAQMLYANVGTRAEVACRLPLRISGTSEPMPELPGLPGVQVDLSPVF